MNSEFKQSYQALSINDKRNALSNELMLIGNLISSVESKFGHDLGCQVKNYDKSKDYKLTESQMLDFFYEDVYNIEKEFITLASMIEAKEKQEIDS